MDKSNYQEAAKSHAKEHLDLLLRMETTLERRTIRTVKDRQRNVPDNND